MSELPVAIAYCPEHGLHGRRDECYVCGEPAVQVWMRPVSRRWEIIGVPECPILMRWTALSCRFGKLMIHRFFPGADREDCHDHPASFLTLVLRGGYDDIRKDSSVDQVRAPTVRFRRAEHEHTTTVGPRGALTLVLMGPKRREWGFWRRGEWWPFRQYEERYGAAFRCGREDAA